MAHCVRIKWLSCCPLELFHFWPFPQQKRKPRVVVRWIQAAHGICWTLHLPTWWGVGATCVVQRSAKIKSIDALPIPACCLSFQEDVMVHEVFTETWQQSDKVCQVMEWNWESHRPVLLNFCCSLIVYCLIAGFQSFRERSASTILRGWHVWPGIEFPSTPQSATELSLDVLRRMRCSNASWSGCDPQNWKGSM